MRTADKSFGARRLGELKHTVESLKGQLREVQGELHRVKMEPIPIRLWRSLASRKGRQAFMSDVCNRHARPNTKMVSYADARF